MSKSNSNIVVPETFPFILKTYVKDVVRTQPYDLLSWSAAYFRCIANDIQPPTKFQFEESTEQMIESRSLTKEYLKILVKQIGKGYFVERTVLQERWKALGLQENDLLTFLNICGMLLWERVHWLELLSVMAAFLSQDFESSIDLICESLTESEEGGENSIPVWMFSTCYLFLAQLDLSADKEMKNDEITTSSKEPHQVDARSFRIGLLEEWKSCVGFPNNQNSSAIATHFDRMRKATSFNAMIQMLSEISSEVKDDNSDSEMVESNDAKWKYEIIRRIGAPWNWIYQFVDHYTPGSKSYNFYECEHKLHSIEHLENMEPLTFTDVTIPAIGLPISTEITREFIEFAESKANENDGLVSPTFFTDEKCPRMH